MYTNINQLFPEAVEMTRFAIVDIFMVMAAVAIDLCCGLIKAKTRGEVRSSWGLKRTANKVATYIGVMLIMFFVDCMMHFCHFYHMIGFTHAIGVPFFTSIIALFFLVVEVISMFESADKKTKTEINRGRQVLGNIVNREEIIDIVSKSITRSLRANLESDQNDITETDEFAEIKTLQR